MADLALPWNGDLIVGPTGDFMVIAQNDPPHISLALQRVIRRILTNPQVLSTTGQVTNIAEYLFHPDYGGGARATVDAPRSQALLDTLRQRIFYQISLEPFVVNGSPNNTVTLTPLQDGLQADITVELQSGQVISIVNLRVNA